MYRIKYKSGGKKKYLGCYDVIRKEKRETKGWMSVIYLNKLP